jgi:3'(2'), 5'-bisphosphate nucleotidase
VLTLPCDEPATTPRPLERTTRVGVAAGIRFCESWEGSHSDQSATRRVMQRLADQGHALGPPARIDSQCKYAVVARGQVDVFLRRPRDAARRDWIWDHAPGYLIATRAGLTVSDAHARPVDFGLGRTLAHNHGVLAADAHTHPLVVDALRAV